MEREEIEQLRKTVGCGAVLETSGFAVDVRESTRRAMKFRRGSEIIIVTHEGRGWFDPLGDEKGDVFSLMSHLEHVGFHECCERIAALIGFRPSVPAWQGSKGDRAAKIPVFEKWENRRAPWPGSATWRYLRWQRSLPARVIRSAIAQGVLREGPYGSMWAGHTDDAGVVCGWEERGSEWRGFATGGNKVLFRLGAMDAPRLCVTEAAIDAMSLGAIEGLRDGTMYLSTGGGWSPATDAAMRVLAARPNVQLVAATDANPQGDMFAERLRTLADEAACDWMRLRPPEDDWNDTLKISEKEKRERKEKGRGVPHSGRPRQGQLRPAEPAGPHAGGPEGVLKDGRG
ncbi:DUF3991 and toprim domain-containing protein [Rhizobium azibense]|uniref:Toprim domain-containing protein n=1 Tax=Rhizobium azibense TaxID=1136135 RepID=A0A4R3RG41_9HYPH|nr:DUF3991 and toprim domain-containing protein [Rhizobium azibense]TCU33584.1 Toprim domain-containing protein [Rhizobium azibense]